MRRLHLMEPAAIGDALYPFMNDEGADPVHTNDEVAPAHPKWKSSPSSLGEGDHPEGGGGVSNDGSENPSTSEAGPPPRRAGEDLGRVYINPHQYFADVPKRAWDFHIGGYQPAQKWLKDRKGRALSWDDIGHYQNIVKILIETDRIMGEIELPLEIQTGGEA